MEIKNCPLSDKLKLKMVLKGDQHICPGHYEMSNTPKEYQIYETCPECPYHDVDANSPNSYGYTYGPQGLTGSTGVTGLQGPTGSTWTAGGYNNGTWQANTNAAMGYYTLRSGTTLCAPALSDHSYDMAHLENISDNVGIEAPTQPKWYSKFRFIKNFIFKKERK